MIIIKMSTEALIDTMTPCATGTSYCEKGLPKIPLKLVKVEIDDNELLTYYFDDGKEEETRVFLTYKGVYNEKNCIR